MCNMQKTMQHASAGDKGPLVSLSVQSDDGGLKRPPAERAIFSRSGARTPTLCQQHSCQSLTVPDTITKRLATPLGWARTSSTDGIAAYLSMIDGIAADLNRLPHSTTSIFHD